MAKVVLRIGGNNPIFNKYFFKIVSVLLYYILFNYKFILAVVVVVK